MSTAPNNNWRLGFALQVVGVAMLLMFAVWACSKLT